MHSIQLRNVLYLVVFLMLLSCNSQNCPEIVEGVFDLSDLSLSKIPFTQDSNLFYEDEEGRIISAELQVLDPILVQDSTVWTTCPWPDGDRVSTELLSFHYLFYIIIEELQLKFSLKYDPHVSRIDENFNPLIKDIFSVEVSNSDGSYIIPSPFLSVITDWRDIEEGPIIAVLGDVEILGRTYKNVYHNSSDPDNVEFYFSFEEGLIGILDNRSGKILRLR